MANQTIFNLYKKAGETPLECLKRFRKSRAFPAQMPMTYAGRLDPMAEGVLIILVGDEVKNKKKFTNLEKEYEFEVLWGIETDTYDALGKIKDFSGKSPDKSKINSLVKEFIGEYDQVYPPYSSKTVDGRQMFELARKGISTVAPKKKIKISSIEILSNIEKPISEICSDITRKINLINGDFRQAEIIEEWGNVSNSHKKLLITKMRAKVSSGTYIRSLAHNLGNKSSCKAIALSIKRLGVGNFSIISSLEV